MDTPTPISDETEKIADKLPESEARYGFTLARMKQLECELAEATKQRDRLKEALERIANNRVFTPIEWLAIAASALAAVEGGKP